MVCPNCGSYIPDYSAFCTECGCMIDNQPVYDNRLTDYEDPIGTENAKTYIKKAKVGLITSIIAIGLVPAIMILNFILGMIPVLGWIYSVIVLAFSPFIGFFGGIASWVCFIVSLVSVHKAITLQDVIPGTVNPELFGKYISAQKHIKAARIMNKVFIIKEVILFALAALVVLLAVGIALILCGGPMGVMALVGNF